MDTDWYAVDANGRVGYMRSGEEGAVPYSAHRQYWRDLFADLVISYVAVNCEEVAIRRALAAATDPIETKLLSEILAGDRPSRIVYADWLESHGREADGWSPRERAVFYIGTMRVIDPASLPPQWDGVLQFESAQYLEMFNAEYGVFTRSIDIGMVYAVAVTGVPKYLFDDYWEAGAIVNAYVIDRELAPHVVGLFEYACSFSGPYHRREVPREPLYVDALPEPIRNLIAQLRIPVSFAATEELEPQRYADCQEY